MRPSYLRNGNILPGNTAQSLYWNGHSNLITDASGGNFNIKMLSYHDKNSHWKNKSFKKILFFKKGIPVLGKMVFISIA